ncbi:MAG: radical SAM protein [Nanoarchaeota archaeon]
MRVNLIRPRTDDQYSSVKQVYSSFPPPVGPSCLGAVLRDMAEVQINDENLSDVDFDADIIGIQSWVTTHNGALRLADQAKQSNPCGIVVLGGTNASHLAERILHNHPYIDYVVVGHGEETIMGLVNGRTIEKIPNLCYRKNRKVVRNQEKFSRSPLFDLEQVVQWECDDQTPFPISGIRGCIKAAKQGICEYCSLQNERVMVMKPDNFWKQVRVLKEKYSLDYFFETGDEFIVGKYPEQLLATRPADLSDVTLRIYSYPETLAQEGAIDTLARLNVRELYMGIETINEPILRKAGRNYNTDVIDDIFQNLSRCGIKAMVPFMFGLPGESNDSAQRNFDFSQQLLERYNHTLKMVQYSLVVPIVGSNYFTLCCNNGGIIADYNGNGKNLLRDDDFDYSLLTELFIKECSSANINFLRGLIERGKRAVVDSGILTSTFIGIEDKAASIEG